MLSEDAKKNIRRFEFIFIIILIIAVPLIFFKSSITGFVSSDTKAQVLNIDFTESKSLQLVSTEPVYVSSFSISGEITGEGDVAVYLTNGEAKSLVYTNVGQKKKAPLITGAATGIAAGYAAEETKNTTNEISLVINEGKNLSWPGDLGANSASGSFTSVCIDSCYLESGAFTSNSFELEVFVEPGTTFKLQEIFYTIG